ncbi:hypothetical protein EU805_15780 [Salipiger sp. IMCC34102]|nr:hypothetical protein EU805_15780 [Salipiger sp. IMCC34102]
MRAVGPDSKIMDICEAGIVPQDLETLFPQNGEAAVNRASTTWRQLPEDARTGSEADLIAAHPTLLKRSAIE